MRTIYLCGPRSGPDIVNTNIELFDSVATALRQFGHTVLNPVDVNLAFLGTTYSPTVKEPSLRRYPGLRADIIAMLSCCDTIALMPGWDNAIGCRLEVATAITFRYAFCDYRTAEIVPHPRAVCIDHGYNEVALSPGFAAVQR